MKTPRTPKYTPELDPEQHKQAIAYQLWEEEGRPDGKAEEHWAQACLVVMSLAEGDGANAPVWLKRQDTPSAPVAKAAEPDLQDKRAAARQAA